MWVSGTIHKNKRHPVKLVYIQIKRGPLFEPNKFTGRFCVKMNRRSRAFRNSLNKPLRNTHVTQIDFNVFVTKIMLTK